MRVGVIMYQTSNSKGQELVAQRMVKELNRQGHFAVLITSRFHDGKPVVRAKEVWKRGGYVSYDDEDIGMPVCRVRSHRVEWPPRRINFVDFISILGKIVKKLDLNVLVTHSTQWNGPDLTAQFVSWQRRLALGSKGKRVIFCHMSHFQPPGAGNYSRIEREWRKAWNAYTLTRIVMEADILLVTTPLEERSMVEHGAMRGQCVLFPGGIEAVPRRTKLETEDFRRRHSLPLRAKLVTFLGTVEDRKNPRAVVDVARLVRRDPDLRLVIAGRAEGPYAKKILASAKRLGNLDAIGEISEDDKASLIRTSYLNIAMSKNEALGLVQLEFMSAGVPVVTSGVGGQSWIVKNRQNGIVLRGPGDVRGAASAVVGLGKDEERRNEMGRNAERFASRFLMSTLVRNLARELRSRFDIR